MNSVLAIAEQMLVDRIIGNKAPVTGESKARFLLAAFTGLTGVLALGFLLSAIYLWLDANHSTMVTLAAMGAIFLSLSLLAGGTLFAIVDYKRKKFQQMKKEIIDTAEQALKIFQEELKAPVNDNPKSSILAASIAGYIAGERFL